MILDLHQFVAFWAKVDTSAGATGCWRWRGTHNPAGGNGSTKRPRVRVKSGKGPGTHMYVARVMLLLQDPDLEDLVVSAGYEACHRRRCPSPWCINPLHLYWGTKEDNLNDRWPQRKIVGRRE